MRKTDFGFPPDWIHPPNPQWDRFWNGLTMAGRAFEKMFGCDALWFWFINGAIAWGDIHVYQLLFLYSRRDGDRFRYCHMMTNERIASETNMSVRQVIRSLKKLKQMGLLWEDTDKNENKLFRLGKQAKKEWWDSYFSRRRRQRKSEGTEG